MRSEPGVRYQYQLLHLDNHRIWLALAWHGQTKLEPACQFINPNLTGELDALLMQTLNELAAAGWGAGGNSVGKPTLGGSIKNGD
ncbi:hypothetical protein [Hymenobacter glaciei]|uniref:hypothetical protein n=1 Tax=Hymenobacter glaciei TaxID=877209 RepID=UPI0031E9C81D